VGSRPLLENIATLMEPPGSDRSEATWLADVLVASGCDLLLDLHNLYANLTNFGGDASAFLNQLPTDRIRAIHLAGGRWIATVDGQAHRLLDDHRHDVPDPVYALLTEVARRVRGPLVVILERDGDYPAFDHLLAQMRRAREALHIGRALRSGVPGGMTSNADRLEVFLARLYSDAEVRRRFVADRDAESRRAGLDDATRAALAVVDGGDLELASRSFEKKRGQKRAHPRGALSGWLHRIRDRMRRRRP